MGERLVVMGEGTRREGRRPRGKGKRGRGKRRNENEWQRVTERRERPHTCHNHAITSLSSSRHHHAASPSSQQKQLLVSGEKTRPAKTENLKPAAGTGLWMTGACRRGGGEAGDTHTSQRRDHSPDKPPAHVTRASKTTATTQAMSRQR